MRSMAMILVSACLVGCATAHVKQMEFTDAYPRRSVDGYSDTYMLSKTVLTLSRSKHETKADAWEYTVQLRRSEYPRKSFAVTATNRFGVKTNISIVKVENTQLIQSATVAVEDKRTEFITKSAKLLGTVIGFAYKPTSSGLVGSPLDLPEDFDTLALLSKKPCGREECETISLVRNNREGVDAELDVGAVPPDAIDLELFTTQLDRATGVLAFSSCRPATVTITMPGDTEKTVLRFSLADPRYIQLAGLPPKGTITSHSECGYSILPENATLASNLDVAQAALDELIKLKAAYDKGKEDAEKGSK